MPPTVILVLVGFRQRSQQFICALEFIHSLTMVNWGLTIPRVPINI